MQKQESTFTQYTHPRHCIPPQCWVAVIVRALTLLFFISALFLGNVSAQNRLTYHLNDNNGLPSNHIYATLTDRLGYLWFATEKGVVKYNGYTTKLFTTAEGLPTDDVWGLLEDKKGRIWLATQSNEIGYLYNDSYHKTYLKGIKGNISPYKMNHFDSGIIFCSGHVNNRVIQTICFEKNDTIYPFPISKETLPLHQFDSASLPSIFINKHKEVLFFTRNDLLVISDLEKTQKDLHNAKVKRYPVEAAQDILATTNATIFLNRFTISCLHNKQANTLSVFNVTTSQFQKFSLDSIGIKEPIEYMTYNISHNAIDEFYVFTKNYLLTFLIDGELKLTSTHNLKDVVNNEEGKKALIGYNNDELWNLSVATAKHGVYLTYGHDNAFKPLSELDLSEYAYTGTIDDTVTTWWNSELKSLVLVAGNKVVHKISIFETGYIRKVVRYNRDSLLLSGTYNYFYEPRKNELSRFFVGGISTVRGMQIVSADDWIFASLTGIYRTKKVSTGFTYNQLDADRYNDLVYDSLRKCLWAYNNNKILHISGLNKTLLNDVLPPESGKIEKICVDNKHGAIFIKTLNSLFMYDHERGTTKELNYNINLKKANISLHNGTLIVYGEFGILFTSIKDKYYLSDPLIYYNLKKLHYSKCFTAAVSNNKVILLTNKGTYEVNIPTPSEIEKAETNTVTPKKTFTYTYNDSIKPLHENDTLLINQKKRLIQFDVINPAGNGGITYFYKYSGDVIWQKTAQGDVIIPQSFEPGNYNTISVICMDDAWKSNIMTFTIYVRPYWWQTRTANNVFWIGGSSLAILIILVVILITRKMVTRANEKKNMQMELELKAIYAQINPHFIFNTLTSAMLLVSKNKMEEAYTHISKFSRLLRSYLKSSRNKYISIREEVENLTAYTELQQTRFKDRFTCYINVDPELNNRNLSIPSLLIQPFVENAINHGILHSAMPGVLIINFIYVKEKNEIVCTITDNGIGRAQARENKKKAERTLESYGNLMIKDLVSIFNKYEKMNIRIEYEDKQAPETGTIVSITISNPHNA